MAPVELWFPSTPGRTDDGSPSGLDPNRMTHSERFSLFFARRRHAFALVIAAVTVFFAAQMRHLEIFTQFLDLLPRDHRYIQTYETYRDVYGTANAVVAAVIPDEGDIYQADVLGAVLQLTEGMDSSVVSAEVNARPVSDFIDPDGPVERLVHGVVKVADGIFGRGEAVQAETGVEHNHTVSITHRTVRDQRVLLDGTLTAPQMILEIPTNPAEWKDLRKKVRRNPSVYGVIVALDERATLVRTSFLESRIDYAALFKHLRQLETEVEARWPVTVHLTGQPMLFGWSYAFATEILLIFLATIILSVTLLWAYFRRLFGVFLPLSGAIVNIIWGLGFAAWMGFHMDPLVLVVPMLITARAISHSVQFVERFYEEYEEIGDKEEACVRSMAELLLPGTLAILTDCVGLLTISLATIPLIEKLGLLCAFWAASIVVTEMLLNRLLILYLPAPRERERRVPVLAARILRGAAALVCAPAGAVSVVVAFAGMALASLFLAEDVPVGENRPGTPILYPDSEFNVAAGQIGERFFGLDELLVVAYSDTPGRVFAPDALKHTEALQRVLETDPAAGGSVSLVDLFKQTSRLFHNNDPRWGMWLQTTSEVVGFQYLIETSVPAQGVLDPYRARDGQSISIRTYYRDHQATTVARADALMRRFAEDERIEGEFAARLTPPAPGWPRRILGTLLPPPEPQLNVTTSDRDGGRVVQPVEVDPDSLPDGVLARFVGSGIGRAAELRSGGSFGPYELWVRAHDEADWQPRPNGVWLPDGVELRLAAGTMGVLAAANQEIAESHRAGLLVVFVATFLIITLTYRSLLVGCLLTVSLGTAALAALAVQSIAGIGINVNTLPVQAIGVGIGVDYAIYIVDRVREELRRGLQREAALARAIETTGLAIAFTATTLLAGIVFWIPISSLRFSADMSLLLSVLMAINAVGAVLLVPALLRLVPESWIRKGV